MNESHIKQIEYKIIRELHKGKKSVAELTDIITTTEVDSSIKLNLITFGLYELTTRGFVNEKRMILKEPKGNREGKRYFLTEAGQKFYKSIYG